MAATSSFAGSLLHLRCNGSVRCPRAGGSWSTGGGRSLKIRSSPLLLFPLFPERGRRRPATAIPAADTYYDDDGENSDGGDGETERRRAAPASTGEAARRLYVGNLPYSMTPSNLSDVFSEAGTVTSVEVVYDRVTDRSRGFAFVTLASADEAWAAIRMFDGSQLGGRTVKVNFPEVPRGGEREVMGPRLREARRGFVDSPHKLYAGNLSWVVSSDALRAAFAGCAGLLSAKVVYERDTARSRGYGFVSFASAEDAQSALSAMDGVELEGRPLRLNVAMNNGSARAGGGSSGELEAAGTPDGATVVSP
ncbi:unnamed protein product [Spirodela intermedia]|uniref:RRM domain-containing protein n=1 Tax=Spirodela intermedia TaxID=51605 RepID=A0A7I8JWE2_SPIIN|nr:unnamed protein product [Spirodela intermedia]